MKFLIFETSTDEALVLLATENAVLATHTFAQGPDLSQKLAPTVDTLLKKHTFLPEAIGVGTGPGAYTGIRVGASLAQALAFGFQIPLIGFDSPLSFRKEGETLPILIDAKSRGIFCYTTSLQLYPLEEIPLMEDFLSPHPKQIQKRLPTLDKGQKRTPLPESLIREVQNPLKTGSPNTQSPLKLSY